jgi:E3 ubiquitin-protein ligase RNF38/44
VDIMSHRNLIWTQQLVNPESAQGSVQVQRESFYYGGIGSDPSDTGGAQVTARVPGNTDLQHYYERSRHEHQHVQNLYPHVGVASDFAFLTAMYNPSMSATAMNTYVPQDQNVGLGHLVPLSSYQVAAGTMDENNIRCNFGDSATGFIKRKNAVAAGNHHFLHGFASSSSSSYESQNPPYGPWNTYFQPNCLPSSAASNPPEYHSSNGWPFLERSPADGCNSFSSVAAQREVVHHHNYLLPTCHMGQCNTWTMQAANGIVHGVPQWGYCNAVTNLPSK